LRPRRADADDGMNATTPTRSARHARDYRCEACGYQIAIPQPHPICPMCGDDLWALVAEVSPFWRRERLDWPVRHPAPAHGGFGRLIFDSPAKSPQEE
jgi:hypothetical protein